MLTLRKTDDLTIVKKMIASRLGWTIDRLEEEIEKIREGATELITERAALLILLDKYGVSDPEIIERLTSEYAVIKIDDLAPRMRRITVLGRIMRIILRKDYEKMGFIIADGSGRAVVYLQGRVAKIFSQLGLEEGDIILIRRINVGSGRIDEMPVLYGDDETEITYIDETDLSYYPAGIVPSLPRPLEISEVKKIIGEEEVQEIDLRGVFDRILETREIIRKGKRIKFVNAVLIDEKDSSQRINILFWRDRAEDLLRGNILPGDIIIVRGVRKRKREIRGEETIELRAGNLSSLTVIGSKKIKVKEAENALNDKAVFYVIALDNPIVRKYKRDGETRRFLILSVADDTGKARLIVWDEKKIDDLAGIKKGDKLRIYGVIKASRSERFAIEIHVSKYEHVLINPRKFPPIQVKIEEREEVLRRPLLKEYSDLQKDQEYDIIGYLREVGEFTRRDGSKLHYIKMADEKQREAIIFIWNEELFSRLKEIKPNTIVLLKGVKTPKELSKERIVFFAGDKTSLEILDYPYDAKLLRFAKAGEESMKIIGTITEIAFVGTKKFCPECHSFIIEESEGKAICEQGHITKPEKELAIIFYLDDDYKRAEVVIRGEDASKLLHEVGLGEQRLEEEKVIKELRARLEGKEVIVRGDIKDSPSTQSDFRIYAREIIGPSYATLLKILEKNIGMV